MAALELLQAPGLPFAVPREYRDRPLLTGRATLGFHVRTGDGRKAFVVEGRLVDRATLHLEVDGYSAPVSGGALLVKALNGTFKARNILDRNAYV